MKTKAPAIPAASAMPDVQSARDPRHIAIDRVGVKDVIYPIRLRTPDGGEQKTVATVNMLFPLPVRTTTSMPIRRMARFSALTSAMD